MSLLLLYSKSSHGQCGNKWPWPYSIKVTSNKGSELTWPKSWNFSPPALLYCLPWLHRVSFCNFNQLLLNHPTIVIHLSLVRVLLGKALLSTHILYTNTYAHLNYLRYVSEVQFMPKGLRRVLSKKKMHLFPDLAVGSQAVPFLQQRLQ